MSAATLRIVFCNCGPRPVLGLAPAKGAESIAFFADQVEDLVRELRAAAKAANDGTAVESCRETPA